MNDVFFEDRFGLIVDVEYNDRKSNSLNRLIKNAGFNQREAYISDINYTSGRNNLACINNSPTSLPLPSAPQAPPRNISSDPSKGWHD